MPEKYYEKDNYFHTLTTLSFLHL